MTSQVCSMVDRTRPSAYSKVWGDSLPHIDHAQHITIYKVFNCKFCTLHRRIKSTICTEQQFFLRGAVLMFGNYCKHDCCRIIRYKVATERLPSVSASDSAYHRWSNAFYSFRVARVLRRRPMTTVTFY